MQAGSVARIAALSVAVTLIGSQAGATTMAPTAQGAGPDDWNISTLMPASYITASAVLTNALTAAGFRSNRMEFRLQINFLKAPSL